MFAAVALLVVVGAFTAALLWVAGLGHLVRGNVDLHAMAWLLLGSVPGILISSKFTVKIPDDALRLGLALVLSLSGLKLLELPQANWIIAGGLGAGAIALATFGIRAWLAHPRAAPAGSFD